MTFAVSLFAYIDPGSGAILLQALLALLLTCGVVFRRILFAPVRYFFPQQQGEAPETTAASVPPPPESESNSVERSV